MPWSSRFFSPRRYAADLELKPARLTHGLFSWVWPVLRYKERDIIDEAGLDCAIYLRIMKYGTYLFVGLSLWCLVAVLPVNLTGGAIDALMAGQATNGSSPSNSSSGGSQYKFTDFDKYSLSNVEAGSPKMWVHLVSMYVVAIFTMALLSRFNRESVLLRLMFLGNAKRGGPSHTVLVTNIPAVREVVAKALGQQRREDKARRKAARRGGLGGSAAGSAAASSGAVGGGSSHTPTTALISEDPDDDVDTAEGDDMDMDSRDAPDGRGGGGGSSSGGRLEELQSEQQQPQDGSPVSPALPGKTGAGSGGWGGGGGGWRGSGGPVAESDEGGSRRADAVQPLLREAPSSRRANGWLAATPAAAAAATPAGPSHYNAQADPVQHLTPEGGGDSRLVPGDGQHQQQHQQQQHLRPPRSGSAAGGANGAGGSNGAADTWRQEPQPQPAQLHQQLQGQPDHQQEQQQQPSSSGQRTRDRYNYNLHDKSLDPEWLAKEKLLAGTSPSDLVRQEFEMVYTHASVAAVNMVKDTSTLEPLTDEYIKLMEKLEDYLDMLQLRLKLRQATQHQQVWVLGALYGEWGRQQLGSRWLKKVDAVEWWTARLEYLRERIKEKQAKAQRKAAPSAFVTFNTRMSQAVASSALHAHDVDMWVVRGAPAPFEVVWRNLGMGVQERDTRRLLLWGAFWLMTLFYMVPVAAIQALIEVPKLASVPVLGDIVTAPVVRQLVEAMLPGLVLQIFLALVPFILRIMVLQSGAYSLSEVDFGVVKRFFLFQVVVVFFGNIIAGSFFNQLRQWLDEPGSVVPILGKAIPQTATFFITYLFVAGLFVKSLAFLRLPGFVIFWLLSKFAGSPRARQRLWMYQYTDSGTTVVDHGMTVLLGLVFCCINPIVCPAALAYFLVTGLSERYNTIYVFRRHYESAGKLWGTVFNQVMVGLYIMQLTMLGLLGVKKFEWTPLAIPLLLGTALFHLDTLRRYSRPWNVTSLHDAADLDSWEAQHQQPPQPQQQQPAQPQHQQQPQQQQLPASASAAEEGRALLLHSGPVEIPAMSHDEARLVKDTYKNPCFKVDLQRLDELKALATDLRPRLDLLNAWVADLKRAGLDVADVAAAAGAGAGAGAGGARGPEGENGKGPGAQGQQRGEQGEGGSGAVEMMESGGGAGAGGTAAGGAGAGGGADVDGGGGGGGGLATGAQLMAAGVPAGITAYDDRPDIDAESSRTPSSSDAV
ncbi:hypothetical protein CHLRE_08g360564v5 [Chlamydomonas reinhardtii]|uniref:ERD4-related membrane protein n=1 Tax=Chlamydomonas reinhardtii TaxID=3055 RepID=A0A2K3DGI4_CHLRE|nr:uncharacterized protein CHLRE_08g360564v5 [Chlamydomonas reinhardtii]PNW79626.1 hypothetical protein CHLRE_08g360564v5 [Chlamydomonas reinhardtii]